MVEMTEIKWDSRIFARTVLSSTKFKGPVSSMVASQYLMVTGRELSGSMGAD